MAHYGLLTVKTYSKIWVHPNLPLRILAIFAFNAYGPIFKDTLLKTSRPSIPQSVYNKIRSPFVRTALPFKKSSVYQTGALFYSLLKNKLTNETTGSLATSKQTLHSKNAARSSAALGSASVLIFVCYFSQNLLFFLSNQFLIFSLFLVNEKGDLLTHAHKSFLIGRSHF